MKKTINIILFILICNLGYSQFSCVKTITKNGCKLNLFNANLVKVGDIDLSKSAWYFQSATNIKIADNVNVFNFINTCVTSPTWSALPDSLTSWQNQCVTTSATFPTNLDTSNVDTSLINYLSQFDTIINYLALIKAINYDTTQRDTALDKSVTISNLENYRNVLDSINNKLHSIAFDTSTIDTSLVAQIDYTPYLQKLVSIGYDTSQVDTSLINYIASFDTTINRLDSILASIKRQSSIDTTHTAILQQIQDTLISKLSILDKSDIDTSLVQVIQLNQIIDSLSVLIQNPSKDTTHTAILNDIKELISKLDTSSIDTSLVPVIDYSDLFYALINKGYDTSQVDTALDKHILLDSSSVRILNDSIKVWFTQPLEVSKDTTHQTILSEIKELLTVINSRVDTTQIDTSLITPIDYTQLLYALINKSYDTSQIDTALDKHILLDSTSVRLLNDSIKVYFTQPIEINKDTTHNAILSEIKELLTLINSRVDTTQQDTSLDKTIKLDSTLVRIINDTINVRFIDSTYYTQLDSIKYYLSIDDSIEICFDTITFQTYVTNLPTTICNGDSAVRVQLCNTDSTLNAIVRTKIDTTNAILYRIESKASSDTTHETILQRIEENTKSDCIGSNETYYINGTNTITLLASEVCSYAITVIEDVVSFTENGVTSPFNLPTAYSGSTSFKNGSKLLVNQISFTGVNATSKAIIKVIK